jgi:hypothetical protein
MLSGPKVAEKLIAGRVPGGVEFNTPRTAGPTSLVPATVLPLYTRAADRVEAAIGVHVGRTIDVRG